MSELDLSKAIEAGADGVGGLMWGDSTETDANQPDHKSYAQAALTAALPHILDALAEQAEADKTAAAERFRTAPTATERVDASQWGDVCELAAVYLRARAEEARRG